MSRKQRRDPLPTIEGRPPDLRLPVVGCVDAERCPEADGACRKETPLDVPVAGGGTVRCLKR